MQFPLERGLGGFLQDFRKILQQKKRPLSEPFFHYKLIKNYFAKPLRSPKISKVSKI